MTQRAFSTIGALVALLLAGGGAAAVPAHAAVPAPPQALTALPTGLDDFTVESFDAEYELGRDGEGRSTLRTIERIVILFPDVDQNRGIIRDLVRVYDDHPTDLTVVSVTDENGAPRAFTTDGRGDFLSVTIAVPPGGFVHGAQSYVIEYTQRDVTRRFSDTGADEFYWDVNGTGWAQPFGRVGARVTVANELVPALSGANACYRGSFGSGDACPVAVEGETIAVEEGELGPYENVTLAVGFAPDTFATRPAPFLERVPLFLYGGLASLGGAALLVALTVIRSVRGRRTGRAIIARYEPPEGMTAAVASVLLRSTGKAMTATLLDFAVRRRVRLLHDEPSGLYGVQALSSEGLLPAEEMTYRKLFPEGEPNPTLWFEPRSTRLGDTAVALLSRARSEVRSAGLVGRVSAWTVASAALLLILALLLPTVQAIVVGDFVLMTVLLAVGINVLVWVLLFVIGGLVMLRPRTRAGALLHDELMGLREYIRLAEADRIRMLQSASGAEVDAQRIVRVYERLLPYAVLFGFETEWQGELARYYRESVPEWVVGSSSFSTALPLHAFGSVVATSPATRIRPSGSGSGSGSRSSFSSSHGGSSGGGFSGGGGGGGGGRGI